MKSDVGTESDKINNEQTDGGSSPSSNKKKYIIIGAIAGGVVLIVAIVLIVVFVTKNDDDSSSSSSEVFIEPLPWDEAYKLAEEAMKNLSNEEKFNLLFGTDNLVNMWDGVCVGFIEPNSKIENFRGMCLQDGPAGVRAAKKTTSWQAQINTASTFNRTLWHEYGRAYGNDFRKKGVNVALGPAMNILRAPTAGRIWESYSEDPFLSGEAATYIIKAIQSTGVIACAKHYIGNDQETNRKNSSSNIPEQALWEIYLEPFYRSVNDGDVASIMSSYNDVNGTLLAKHRRLLQEILKDKIGYKGFVMSDWWAIKDGSVDNFNSGEDMNMPGGIDEGSAYQGRDKSHWSNYKDLVGSSITQDRLDDAVRRVLSSMYKLQQLDSKYPEIDLNVDTITDKSKKINREAAGQSNVLLKNENNVLPLSKTKYNKIAIIGNDAFPTDCNSISDCSCKQGSNNIFHGHLGLGYGSGTTTFSYIIDPLTAITNKAKDLGISIVSAGEKLEVLENTYSGDITVTNEDDYYFYGARSLSGWSSGNFHVNLSGVTSEISLYVYAEENGTPDLQVAVNADPPTGYITLYKSEGVKNFWSDKDANGVITITLNSSSIEKIQASTSKEIAFYGNGITIRGIAKSAAALSNFKNLPKASSFVLGKENLTEAETVASAKDIDLFIVFLMADSGEQYITLENSIGDRQDMDAWHNGNELVEKIVGKKTVDGKTRKIVVVINAPGPINLPFLSNVDGIIFSGMGGAESGNGLVDVLFGDLNPSGHLPYVWGTKAQYPADFDILSNPTNYEYSEGVFIGQRWFDKKGYTPIFPFGFGLSYTTFSFSDIAASYDSNEKKLTATFKVKNAGSVDGDAVPMLFLKFPDSVASDSDNGEYPSKLFKGFEKVFVKAGETISVTITVDEHALSYYSVSKSAFVLPSGTFTVYIGHNAGDFDIQTDFTIS